MQNINTTDWIHEAKNRMHDHVVAKDEMRQAIWINKFRSQAHEMAAPMQDNGKRQHARILNAVDWDRAALLATNKVARMDNVEYEQAFVALETSTELTNTLLKQLTYVGYECSVRGLEQSMGKRNRRGKSSAQGKRFVRLVNALNNRFKCRLSHNHPEDLYVARPANS